MRRLRTVRISLTDRCDLDCSYCNEGPAAEGGGVPPPPPEGAAGRRSAGAPSRRGGELSADEVTRIAEAASLAGARTVRLTGGEPLLREDLEEIVARVSSLPGVEEVALTTNGRRLRERVEPRARAGLARVNIGLPSLRPETYRRMTGGEAAPALAGMEAALRAGLEPVRINVVVVAGENADEIADFVELARARPVEVRFIERMPFAGGSAAGSDGLVPASTIRERIVAALRQAEDERPESVEGALGDPALSPTAAVYAPEGFAGKVGVISPVTEPFCERCDRLRVTADGRLRACLSEPGGPDEPGGPGDADLAAMLRAGADVRELAGMFQAAFARKPARHRSSFSGAMRRIGG